MLSDTEWNCKPPKSQYPNVYQMLEMNEQQRNYWFSLMESDFEEDFGHFTTEELFEYFDILPDCLEDWEFDYETGDKYL